MIKEIHKMLHLEGHNLETLKHVRDLLKEKKFLITKEVMDKSIKISSLFKSTKKGDIFDEVMQMKERIEEDASLEEIFLNYQKEMKEAEEMLKEIHNMEKIADDKMRMIIWK